MLNSFKTKYWEIIKPASVARLGNISSIAIVSMPFHKMHTKLGDLNMNTGSGWAYVAIQTRQSIKIHGDLFDIPKHPRTKITEYVWGDEANIFIFPTVRSKFLWYVNEWIVGSRAQIPNTLAKNLTETILWDPRKHAR